MKSTDDCLEFCGCFLPMEKDGTYNRKKCKGFVQKVKTQYSEYFSTHRNVCMQYSQLSIKIKCAFAFYHVFLWISFQVRISEDLPMVNGYLQLKMLFSCDIHGYTLILHNYMCFSDHIHGVLCLSILYCCIWVKISISGSITLNYLWSEVTEVMTKILHLNIKFMSRKNSIRGLKD